MIGEIGDFGKSEVVRIYRSGSWVAVHASAIVEEEVRDFFIIVTNTPDGARLLPEIELLAGESRTRKFLNQDSLTRLEPYVEADKLDDLELLFERFQEEIKKSK